MNGMLGVQPWPRFGAWLNGDVVAGAMTFDEFLIEFHLDEEINIICRCLSRLSYLSQTGHVLCILMGFMCAIVQLAVRHVTRCLAAVFVVIVFDFMRTQPLDAFTFRFLFLGIPSHKWLTLCVFTNGQQRHRTKAGGLTQLLYYLSLHLFEFVIHLSRCEQNEK